MTTHNALQAYTALSRAYKNALGLDEGGLERAGETLTPTFPLFELPEYALQRGELLATLYASQAAVAAEYSGVGVGVAPGAGLLIVVEPESRGVVETGAIAQMFVYGMSYTDFTGKLATPVLVNTLDSRRWNGAGGALNNPAPVVGRAGSDAALAGTVLAVTYSDSANIRYQSLSALGPIVISPGYAMACWTAVVNQAIRVQLRLRVRTLQPGENSA